MNDDTTHPARHAPPGPARPVDRVAFYDGLALPAGELVWHAELAGCIEARARAAHPGTGFSARVSAVDLSRGLQGRDPGRHTAHLLWSDGPTLGELASSIGLPVHGEGRIITGGQGVTVSVALRRTVSAPVVLAAMDLDEHLRDCVLHEPGHLLELGHSLSLREISPQHIALWAACTPPPGAVSLSQRIRGSWPLHHQRVSHLRAALAG